MLVATATSITVVAALNGAAGYLLLSRAPDSDPSHVDAIVVLGGEHDGREDYGVGLARRGLASTVVLSDPYPRRDPVMARLCRPRDDGIDVLCAPPEPSTTRGEAKLVRRLAGERRWKSVMVISWRYHLLRARLVFRQCLSSIGVAVTAAAVPRHYVLPVGYWEYLYLYQFGGIAEALTVDADTC